jgi:hypothetical protein
MLITRLDGIEQKWRPKSSGIIKPDDSHKSSLHIKARKLLHEIFETCLILEEVVIPIFQGEILYFDFYIPLYKLAIEIHGEQHFKFTPFFHDNKSHFLYQQKCDRDKKTWCEINNVGLIELFYNESEEIWKTKIKISQ